MNNKQLTNNLWFRLLTPLFLGFVAYMIILMLSGRLDQVLSLFFGIELLLTIITAYLVLGIVRLVILLFFSTQDGEELITRRILLQLLATLGAAMVVAAIPISVYMRFFLGYTNFSKELNYFLIIFGFSTFFYNLLYFSLYYLNLKNTVALDHERHLHEQLLKEFNGFIRDIHPDFFYMGLETLIVLIRKDKNEADKFINKFSGVFRYIIECKKKDISGLSDEIVHLDSLLYVFNQKYNDRITLELKHDEYLEQVMIVPCTLHCMIEQIILSSIITKESPLNIKLEICGNELLLSHNGLKKIKVQTEEELLKDLSKTQNYLMGRPIVKDVNGNGAIVRIPTLVEEIEAIE